MKSPRRYYVYVYSDPETHCPFYVGKGTGYRVRRHFNFKKPKTDKQKKLRALFDEHRNPVIEIVQWDLTNAEAEKAEAALIAQYGLRNLANMQSGRGTVKLHADFLEYTLTDERATIRTARNGVPAAVIQLDDGYRPGMSAYEVYDYVRGPLRIPASNDKKVRSAKLILVLYNKWVLDVYVNPIWKPAGMSPRLCRPNQEDDGFEFTASFASPKVRNRYIGRRLNGRYSIGEVRVVMLKA